MRAALPTPGAGTGRHTPLYMVVLAVLLGGFAYLLGSSWTQLFPPPLFSAHATNDCNLRISTCEADFQDERSIRLGIEPRDLPPTQPLRAMVDTRGFDADTVAIEFSGVDMNMGLIRNELTARSDRSFAGDTVLPVCIRRSMVWRATVTAEGPDGIHKATFDFEVRRP